MARCSDRLGGSIRDINYARVGPDLSQNRIPLGAGNHQQAPHANAWQSPFETPAIHPSGGLAGDVHAETTDIFQNAEDTQMQQIMKRTEKR